MQDKSEAISGEDTLHKIGLEGIAAVILLTLGNLRLLSQFLFAF